MSQVNTIFIVDDDTTQTTMLKDHLSKFPAFTLHVFNTGEECLKNLDLNPQIIFLDYNFELQNAMNGIDVLKKIKETKPEIEVVMLSGQDKIQVAVNTIKYGAFDYIVKSESAFLRSERVIFNIIKSLKLEGERNLYKKLTYALAITMIITFIVLIIVFKMGYIATYPTSL